MADDVEAVTVMPMTTALQSELERLGRERPSAFKSLWSEIGFVFSIVMSQFLTEYFVSGFPVLLPTLIRELDIPTASSVWPATAFSLVIASTLLIFGRLGDMWGGYPVFLSGLVWFLVWTIVAGFSINPLMLDICRALQGLGPAAFLPTGVMLMSRLYRPGPRKNLVFAIYGTSAVFGFFGGILVAGVVGQFLRWGFYFWIGAMMTAITVIVSVSTIPYSRSEEVNPSGTKMDYPGAITIMAGLTLTVFAITQSAHAPAGWKTPYIPACFALGLVFLAAAVYTEVYIATRPLLPASIFTTPSMTPLLLALFLLYGTWGIFSVYGTLYFQDIMSASPLQIVAWYTPLGVAGLLFSILEGFILHLVPGRVLLIISGLGAVGSQLLLALIPLPPGGGYWAYVFPATVLSTIGIDLSTILMTVFITTTFPASEQGLAGGVINSVLQLGVAVSLGLTDILQSATVEDVGLGRSYKNTFWFGVTAAAVSLLLMAAWGRVPKATSELTPEEKEVLMTVLEQEGGEVGKR
nr:drug resistance protein [Quercus suber]